jgi:hypothetical protein
MQRTQQDPADLAYQLGVARALNKQYEGMLEREQSNEKERPAHPRRHWTQSLPVVILCWLVFIAVGVRFAPHLYGWWYGWEDGKARTQAMPTANVETQRAAPTGPQGGTRQRGGDTQQPAAEQPAASYSGDARELVQTPTPQPGIPAAGASEAEIQEWLDGPVSTETPLPEPGEPGFAESFAEQPQCSPFVGYLAGDPCVEILKQQAGE